MAAIVWREHPYKGRHVASIGQVEAGAVLEVEGGRGDWAFFLPSNGFSGSFGWKRERTLDKAKACVERATNDWLRRAGILGEIEAEQPAETAA
ncbi:MAG: hypothetical protein KDJ44_09170 [Rhodoblastus sp.]|nr:hypothetical protein [Rhodoblastus sp.]